MQPSWSWTRSDSPHSDSNFDTVLDCGFFHVFDDEDRVKIVESLSALTVRGGEYHMLCFSDRQPGDWGPRRVTETELRRASPMVGGWIRLSQLLSSSPSDPMEPKPGRRPSRAFRRRLKKCHRIDQPLPTLIDKCHLNLTPVGRRLFLGRVRDRLRQEDKDDSPRWVG